MTTPAPQLESPWWVANATNPDALFDLADQALKALTTAQEKAFDVASRLSTGENNRHTFKLGAIERLMQSVNPSGKPYSFSAASELVGSDESYRDYLNHLDNLSRDLEKHRNEAQLAGMRYRLILEAIRRTNQVTP